MRSAARRLAAVLLAAAAAGAAVSRLAAQTELNSGQAPAAVSPAPAVTTMSARPPALPPQGAAGAPGVTRTGAAAPQAGRPEPARRAAGLRRWIRSCFQAMGVDAAHLDRVTVAAIALLAAFLTVVQTWQIPPSNTPLANQQSAPASASKAAAPAAGEPPGTGAAAGKNASPFDSNFARTVFSGLGGMFAVTFLESVWNNKDNKGFDAKSLYLILFVVFFLAILLSFSLLRAAGEALRSRVAVPFLPPPFQPRQGHGRLRHSLLYWLKRYWLWLVSWRSSLLVFWDTAFNVIQGRNELETVVFQASIIDLQLSLVRTTSQICQEIHAVVVEALMNAASQTKPDEEVRAIVIEERRAAGSGTRPTEEIDMVIMEELGPGSSAAKPKEEYLIDYWDVRVNVSMLADDGQSLYYIAWEHGSVSEPFPRTSVAGFAVVSGEARWYKNLEGYKNSPLTEDKKTLALLEEPHPPLVKDYYQDRGPVDYEGFIVLPIPWGRRGEAGHYRSAVLHISFRNHEYMDLLWDNLDSVDSVDDKRPNYQSWKGLLSRLGPPRTPTGDGKQPPVAPSKPTVTAVLVESVAVLAELLRPFNQQVFKDYIRPRIRL
jgi:hypothetical protein